MNIELPDNEIYYLYQYMVSSRMNQTISITTKFSNEVAQITNYFLQEMEKYLGTLTDSNAFFIDLGNHIKPMLNRLEHDIKVHNSLIEEIKLSYPDIFNQVKHVSKQVREKFDLATIDDNEVGFITLYFARIRESNREPINTIIMCTTGIGTSELLKVKIERKFPELNILDVVSSRELEDIEANYTDVKLLISTVGIEPSSNLETLLISSMLNSEDKARLRKVIGEIYDKR